MRILIEGVKYSSNPRWHSTIDVVTAGQISLRCRSIPVGSYKSLWQTARHSQGNEEK